MSVDEIIYNIHNKCLTINNNFKEITNLLNNIKCTWKKKLLTQVY